MLNCEADHRRLRHFLAMKIDEAKVRISVGDHPVARKEVVSAMAALLVSARQRRKKSTNDKCPTTVAETAPGK